MVTCHNPAKAKEPSSSGKADYPWQARRSTCASSAYAQLRDNAMTTKLFDVLGTRYAERKGAIHGL